ncbi:type II secretion system protein [Tepidibacillus fermentans]|uniref:General secretion pathway protein G/type IV pilus assembly protein PilA n=1 Tax=Tepidibacillus fermentans TaxID=1281767 RepID=A0A4R3K834_9BACI|nr:prepilin-type N-terminal cleavage/methylation domain-containing protein [Tepidibacillus fermentans]TCS79047.1 general secretion pathway protein G/type IV pilus assembly protein PilA [Tepidibacillus fermentans]
MTRSLFRKQLSNQRGVTLIELLAVIVILGIIAAVAVPAVLSNIDDSKSKSDAANLQIINDAIERYQVINGSYPAGSTVGEIVAVLMSNANGGPFIKDFPATPQQDGKQWTYDSTNHKVGISE